MGGKIRELPPLIVIAVVMVGAVVWAYLVWRSPNRSDLIGYWQYLIALMAFVGGVIASVWKWRRSIRGRHEPLPAAELNKLADQLAQVVKEEWTRAAHERGLVTPGPIPVRWRWPSVPITEPPSAVAAAQEFQPLPGMTAVTPERLEGGEIRELHDLYGGVGSGRLVIAGAPGSGKSGSAVLLILAALRHREQVSKTERSKVPVPVMFTLHGWGPDQPLKKWLTARLGQTYPQLGGSVGATRAEQLLDEGKIAVILDGLDEVTEQLRPVALRTLSEQATFRLVILTRLDEMAAAAAEGHLEGAAAVELQDVDAQTAADYLSRVQLHPPPSGWGELTDRIRQAPRGPLAEALNTPLTLTLIRDTYRQGDNVRELLEFCNSGERATPRDAIVDHLLDRVLPAGYTQKPGHPPLTYDLQTAQRTLRHIATQMNQDETRDLRWWLIPKWTPRAPRVLTFGLTFGLAAGLIAGLTVGLAAGLAAGLIGGLLVGLIVIEQEEEEDPQWLGPIRWRGMIRGEGFKAGRTLGLIAGIVFGIAAGIAAGLAVAVAARLTVAVVVGLTVALAVGIALVLAVGIGAGVGAGTGVDRNSSLAPLAAWRSDRASGLAFGLAFGLVAGLTSGLIAAIAYGLMAGLTVGLALGLGYGLAYGLVRPAWSAPIAFVQLSVRWHVPVRMMRFLEDAHQRNILRTIGPVYQFRHARLQDRLAEQALANCQNHCTSQGQEAA